MQCKACGIDNAQEAPFCSNCGNALIAVVAPLHEIEIGVISSYGNGWRQLWKNFPILLLIFILSALIVLPGSIVSTIGQNIGGLAEFAGYETGFAN